MLVQDRSWQEVQMWCWCFASYCPPKEEQGPGMQKKPYYCSFACRRTQTESQAQRGEKEGQLYWSWFSSRTVQEKPKKRKKKLVGSESLTRSPGVRVRRMHACPLAWTDGLHLLVGWPGTCLEMHYFFLKKRGWRSCRSIHICRASRMYIAKDQETRKNKLKRQPSEEIDRSER